MESNRSRGLLRHLIVATTGLIAFRSGPHRPLVDSEMMFARASEHEARP
jgi:hypothetical protein